MTVATQTNRTSAVGNAAIGQEVPFSFPYAATSDITVYSRVTATGVETLLAETTNYTLTAASDTGGTLTTVTAVAATSEIHIIRDTPKTQSLDLEIGGSFNAENAEDAWDKNTKLIIENKDSLDRALRAPATDAVALDLELPSSVDRASKNLGFDASGNVTVTDDTGTFTTTYAYWDDLQVKSPWFDVRAYGAEGDGATNDTVAIQAAITAAIVAGGGVVFFPAGTYVCTGVLTVAAASTGITLKGMSITASIIQYSGSVSPFLSLGVATVGFYMEDLKVIYTNALFAGTLINYTNAVRGGLNRCFLTGNAITTATYLLDLDTTIMINISHCRFAYSTYCIRGQDEDGTGYANGVSINNTCDFSEYVTGAIRNPGNGWFIGGGTVFEPTTTDTGGAIVMDVACTSRGLSIDNIWCGDATAVGTWAWIQFKGSGLSVKGSWINGTGHLTQYAIKIIGDSTGIFVAGNYMSSFHYAVGSANSPTITNVVVVGNDFPLCFNDVDIYVEAGALVQRDGNLSIGIGYGVYSTEGHGQPIKEMESPGYNIVSYENDTVYYENDVITYTSITSL